MPATSPGRMLKVGVPRRPAGPGWRRLDRPRGRKMFSECMRVLVAATLACAGAMSVGPVATAADVGVGGWDRPVVLARRGTSADVAVAGNGEMAVLVTPWSGGDRRAGLTVVRRNAGGDWESTTVLRGRSVDFVDAQYDARDRLWVAWVKNETKPKVLVRHTRSGGAGPHRRWSLPGRRVTFRGLQLRAGCPWSSRRGVAVGARSRAPRAAGR